MGAPRLHRPVQAAGVREVSLAAAMRVAFVTFTGDQMNLLLDGYDVWADEPARSAAFFDIQLSKGSTSHHCRGCNFCCIFLHTDRCGRAACAASGIGAQHSLPLR